jgi:hypothetical protein
MRGPAVAAAVSAETGPGADGLRRQVRRTRAARALIIAAAVIEAGAGATWLAAGELTTAAIMAVTVTIMLATAALQTALIRRLRAQEARMAHAARPRPDYAAIAAMETKIWGRPFHHAGAPWQCGWPAWCAPGREDDAAEALKARGILVTRVTGHPAIPDGEVVLVNPGSGYRPGGIISP